MRQTSQCSRRTNTTTLWPTLPVSSAHIVSMGTCHRNGSSLCWLTSHVMGGNSVGTVAGRGWSVVVLWGVCQLGPHHLSLSHAGTGWCSRNGVLTWCHRYKDYWELDRCSDTFLSSVSMRLSFYFGSFLYVNISILNLSNIASATRSATVAN